MTVQYEENPVFEETPTSIFGATAEFPLTNGQINFTAISQSQRTNFTRPPLGFEPAASLVAGVSALFSFDAEPLTQLVSKLPFGATTIPSRIGFSAEFAASRPQTNASQQAYLESFEGEGGFPVSLADPQWYFSSQPALGSRIPDEVWSRRLRSLARDHPRLAEQRRGHQRETRSVTASTRSTTLVSQAGTGLAGPEQLLWLTLYPLSVGGQLDDTTNSFRWTVQEPAGGPALAIAFAPY